MAEKGAWGGIPDRPYRREADLTGRRVQVLMLFDVSASTLTALA